MVSRRGLLKGAVGAAGALVGALAVRTGVEGRESVPEGVQGQSAGEPLPRMPLYSGHMSSFDELLPRHTHPLDAAPVVTLSGPFGGDAGCAIANATLVTGPDPDTYVNVAFRTDGTVIVLPPGAPLLSPESVDRWMGIERAVFPESDPSHGAVTIYDAASHFIAPAEWTVPMIRAHYLYALGQRTPKVPLDGNHLSMRFMPKALYTVQPTLNGEEVLHVTESYDGPDGWLVQMVTDERGNVAVFGGGLRYRILTGNVEHWMDGATVSPGTYTAPLLR